MQSLFICTRTHFCSPYIVCHANQPEDHSCNNEALTIPMTVYQMVISVDDILQEQNMAIYIWCCMAAERVAKPSPINVTHYANFVQSSFNTFALTHLLSYGGQQFRNRHVTICASEYRSSHNSKPRQVA